MLQAIKECLCSNILNGSSAPPGDRCVRCSLTAGKIGIHGERVVVARENDENPLAENICHRGISLILIQPMVRRILIYRGNENVPYREIRGGFILTLV